MERYLVTGGAGFIGSHLVEALLRQGHTAVVLDNFDTGTRSNLEGMDGNLEVIEGTIEDIETLRRAMHNVDYVFHQAARGSVPRSIQDPIGTHDINVKGTLNVLMAARDVGVRRVVCASSSSVYGETAELPKKETMLPSPKSPYALSKLALEHYCVVFYEVYGLETVSLRYFNIYGPRQNPNLQYAAVIPIFITRMLNRIPCTIFGTGEQTRDFTYIDDCVQANLLACKSLHAPGKTYNIACGAQNSVNHLFALIGEILGNSIPPSHEVLRPGDVLHSYADVHRAQSELFFHPQTSVAEGLKKTIAWYKSRGSGAN
jgi:UDP-N-acetylglucosamine/UDP-N-acetyl-alpha-D-glucosaminouronate 4-epimerase